MGSLLFDLGSLEHSSFIMFQSNETSLPISHVYSVAVDLSSWVALIWLFTFINLYYCLAHIWSKIFSTGGIPKSIPWVARTGEGNGPLARARATMQSFLGMEEIIKAGYQKVGSHCGPCRNASKLIRR